MASQSIRSYCAEVPKEVPTVPWFPIKVSDFDFVANRTLCAGAEIESDHPGFNDSAYRARRHYLGSIATNYRAGAEIPRVEYTDVENETWGKVYRYISKLHKQYACQEYLSIVPLMEKHCGFSENNIPQVQDISAFLKKRTGFTLRPVAGLLSSRDFLNGLAFRIFFSTQYIRHHSMPLYTPEPDICHELLGHAPMFADAEFADFSQEIGLKSLGATDEDITKLVALYWFTVEFGMIRDPVTKETKAFGAGLLSSCGELEYSCTAERRAVLTNNENKALAHGTEFHKYWDMTDALVAIPDTRRFNIASILTDNFIFNPPISKYQPLYYIAEDLQEIKRSIREYCNSMPRSFIATYNAIDGILVDREVRRQCYTATRGCVGGVNVISPKNSFGV